MLFENVDETSEKWKNHGKHVFILSWAGRPVYTRYGDEANQSSLMGVFSGVISLVADGGDEIKYVRAGKMVLVFKCCGPIWLASACSTGEPVEMIEQQLVALHSQIISILTNQIHIMLDRKPQLDIRNLLGGTDKYLDRLVSWTSNEPAYLLNSIHAYRIPFATRVQISTALLKHRHDGVYFAILLSGGRLVQLLRPKNHILGPPDLHLLINFVERTDTFRENEAWAPICLPQFSPGAYLHQYVHYLTTDVALLLLSSNPNDFEGLSECRAAIHDSLSSSGILDMITSCLPHQQYSVADCKVKNLRHFLFRHISKSQMTMPSFTAPYHTKPMRKRLIRLYQQCHATVHRQAQPLKFCFRVTEHESVLVWTTSGFELYAVFGPLDSYETCITGCNALNRWIRAEEQNLFIVDSPVW